MSGIFAGMPEGTLITSNGQTYRLTYQGGDGNDVALMALTSIEKWRLLNFGSITDSGNAADNADEDEDGVPNLVEYALAMSPSAHDILPISISKAGNTLEFIFRRNSTATDVTITTEWSDTLGDDWSSADVTTTLLSDNLTTQQLKATVPAGTGRRYLRLRATRP